MTNENELQFIATAPKSSVGDIFSKLGAMNTTDDSVYTNTITILNDILASVRDRYGFMQYGAKTGESYYEHAIKGIDHIIALRHYFFGNVVEHDETTLDFFKMTILAYLIHDLNKQEWVKKSKLKYNEKWSSETARKEIEIINNLSDKQLISEFFPKWDEYIDEIRQMIIGHDEQESMPRGDILLYDYKIADELLEKGWNILKMVDKLDLIRSIKRREIFIGVDVNGNEQVMRMNQSKKIKEIFELFSSITGYAIIPLVLGMSLRWSKLGNIMMNATLKTLSHRNIYPLALCNDGAILFARESDIIDLFDDVSQRVFNSDKVDEIKNEIGTVFIDRIKEIMMNDWRCLYDIKSNGINFTRYTLQKPNIEGKVKKALELMLEEIKPIPVSSRQDRIKKFKTNFSESALQTELLSAYIDDKEKCTEFTENDDVWRLARLIETIFYNVTTQICDIKSSERADYMKEYLESLEIFEDLKNIYDQPKNSKRLYFLYNYYFFPIVADVLVEKGKDVDEINKLIITYLLSKLDTADNLEAFPESRFFVNNMIQLFHFPVSPTALLQDQTDKDDIICSVCGKRIKSTGLSKKDKELYKLWAEYTRNDIKAEASSNTLLAGSGKPERWICPMCKWQFYMDYALSDNRGGNDVIHITFYLNNAYPSNIVDSIQEELKYRTETDEKGRELKTFTFDFKSNGHLIDKGISPIPTKRELYTGFEWLKYKEVVAGSIPLGYLVSGKAKKRKRNESEKYLEVLMNALGIAIYSNMKVSVSLSPNPYITKFGISDAILYDVPICIKRMLNGKDSLTKEELIIVWKLLMTTYDIISYTLTKENKKGYGDRYYNQLLLIEHLLVDSVEALHFLRKKDWMPKKASTPHKEVVELVKKFYEYQHTLKKIQYKKFT